MRPSVYIFAGPTISAVEARRELEAIYLPPASAGDVYRVTLRRPSAIGIIDGYFQSKPAVWHKEILWAMSQGVHVFGSASMGALRAAELAAFGMEGVGVIFESYMDGRLEDDDEVAIAHGPAETGYRALSEAMIDMRETLQKANRVGIISIELLRALERIGKELPYPDRNYSALLRSALERGSNESELGQLRKWLFNGKVSQKREDALAMLRLIRRRIAEGLTPKTVNYAFEHTSMWEQTSRQFNDAGWGLNNSAAELRFDAVVDELRLEGDQYWQHSVLALERFFAIREAHRLGMAVNDELRRETELEFRREHDLPGADQLLDWMNNNGLSEHEFDPLMRDQARIEWVHSRNQFTSKCALADELRLSGDYSRLRARAEEKDRLLSSCGLRNPTLADAGLTEPELLHWYFEDVLHRRVPPHPTDHSRTLGFATPESFRRVLLKEYVYRRLRREGVQNLGPRTVEGRVLSRA